MSTLAQLEDSFQALKRQQERPERSRISGKGRCAEIHGPARLGALGSYDKNRRDCMQPRRIWPL